MAFGFGNGDDFKLPEGKKAVNRLIQENSHIFSDSHCKVCSAVLISESQKLAHYQSKKHANKYRRYMSIQQGEDYTPAKRMKADTVHQQNASDDTDRNKCCPVCNMTFSSPVVAMSHYVGKTHSKNLKMLEQGGVSQDVPQVPKPAPPRAIPEDTDKSDPEKFCQLCSATFNNPHMADQHYKGRRHLKQETKTKLMTIYSSSGNTLPKNAPLNPLMPGSVATANWVSCDTCNVVLNSIEQYEAHISGSKHKNNLNAMTTPHFDSLTPGLKRKSFGSNKSYGSNKLSDSLLYSRAPYTSTGLSSAGGLPNYSSSAGGFSNYSSAGGLSNYSSSAGGLSNYSSSAGGLSNYSSSAGGLSNYSSAGGLSNYSSAGGLSNYSSSADGLSNYSSTAGGLSNYPSFTRKLSSYGRRPRRIGGQGDLLEDKRTPRGSISHHPLLRL